MKLFIVLGNQLFNPKYLKKYSDHIFYMAEDYGLCTFEKHHKLKILLNLSSMRSYKDELKTRGFRVIYNDCIAFCVVYMHSINRYQQLLLY